jgi:hypothetical protein
MAVLTNSVPTILDISKRYTTDGKPLPVAEILTRRKPVFQDIPWVESNTTNGHLMAVEVALPTAVLRKLNQGVSPSKGDVSDVTEATAEFASLGTVDKGLADLSNNVADFRIKQNGRHIEAIGQAFEDQFFYGTKIVPEGFVGLAERYSVKNDKVLKRQILDFGGTGNTLTSIYIVGWGEDSVYGIYAKGTKAGVQHTDYGDELVSDDKGGQYPAYRDWFALQCGLAVQDPRNIARIANIAESALEISPTDPNNLLVNQLIKATHRVERLDTTRPIIYCGRDVFEWLDLQANNRTILALKQQELEGKPVTTFRGIPIRRSDALGWNEKAI